jgi:hypothetical protein
MREIAVQLTGEGFHSARRSTVSAYPVRRIQLEQGWSTAITRRWKTLELDGCLMCAAWRLCLA